MGAALVDNPSTGIAAAQNDTNATYYDDFEDGDYNGWNPDDDSTVSVVNDSFHGSQSLRVTDNTAIARLVGVQSLRDGVDGDGVDEMRDAIDAADEADRADVQRRRGTVRMGADTSFVLEIVEGKRYGSSESAITAVPIALQFGIVGVGACHLV